MNSGHVPPREKFSSRNVKKHFETKLNLHREFPLLPNLPRYGAQIPASKIPFPKPYPRKYHTRRQKKRRVDRAEPIRQTANLPRYIFSRTSTKIQFVENSRLLEEEEERYIYIEREREYRFRATSIMEDSSKDRP